MKATDAKLLDFIKNSPQFIIPIYQRTYSWSERECRQLWDDILRTGSNDKIPAHFVGSIVYISKGLYNVWSGRQKREIMSKVVPRHACQFCARYNTRMNEFLNFLVSLYKEDNSCFAWMKSNPQTLFREEAYDLW